MTNKLAKSKKGFTLVELIVVIAILGVLMAVLVPQYIQYVEKSRIGVDESYIGEVAHAMEIAAAASEKINGTACTVTFDTAGSFSVTATTPNTASAALTAELDTVFPAAKRVFKSTYYKTATVSIVLSTAGAATINGLKPVA